MAKSMQIADKYICQGKWRDKKGEKGDRKRKIEKERERD